MTRSDVDPSDDRLIWELLSRCLDAGERERSRILQKAPKETAEQVRDLLAAQGALDGFLEPRLDVKDESLEPTTVGERTTAVSPVSEGDLPEEIGPYRIVDLLGEGGMGQVYLAEQEEPVRRRVALKILRVEKDGAEARARFLAERDAMGELHHPNVARILDAGTASDGRSYFVMELIEGTSLTRYCDKQRLSLEERVRLFVDVCRGAEHAHQNLILHRDLKPSNVLVTTVDGKPVPRIIDFGISKALATLGTRSMTGERLIGTPVYMSPEALGFGGTIDTRSDVFSLGVMLYELVCGMRPWSREARSPLALLKARREEDPRRPSTQLTTLDEEEIERVARRRQQSPRGLGERLRGDLDWIVMKAIARDPDQRYSSAAGLAADLERFLANEPVNARPATAGYLAQKLLVRHRPFVAMSIVTGLALVLGSIGTTIGLLEARKAERQAVDQAQRAVEARDEAREVTQFMLDVFEAAKVSSSGSNRPPQEITAVDLLQKGSERIDRELVDQPRLAARFQVTLSEAHRELGLFEQARGLLEAARVAMEEVGGEDAILVQIYRSLARLSLREGEFDEARFWLEKERSIALVTLEGDDLLRARAVSLDLSGRLERRAGDFDAAERDHRASIQLWDQIPETSAVDRMAATTNLGSLYFAQQRWREAEAQFREAVDICREELPVGHSLWSHALDNLGASVASQGRLEEAAPLFEEALAGRRRMLGDEHFAVANSLNNLGRLQFDLGNYEEAESLHREALRIRSSVLGSEHPQTAWSLDNLSWTLHALDRQQEAIETQEEALGIRRAALGEDHPLIARSLENLARFSREKGEPEKARTLLLEAIALRESSLGVDDRSLVDPMFELGRTLEDLGQPDEALASYEKSLRLLPDEVEDLRDREDRDRAETAIDRLRAGVDGGQLPGDQP